MYSVTFIDTIHGTFQEQFDTFDAAAEFWQEYADTETCVSGWLIDMKNGEVIWDFDDREKNE